MWLQNSICVYGFRFSMSKKSVFEGQKTYVKGDWLLESLLLMLYVEKKLKDQKREKFQFFRVEIRVIRLNETERLQEGASQRTGSGDWPRSDRVHHREAELTPQAGRQHGPALHPESAVWMARGRGGFLGGSCALCARHPPSPPTLQDSILSSRTESTPWASTLQGPKRDWTRERTWGSRLRAGATAIPQGHGNPTGSRPPHPRMQVPSEGSPGPVCHPHPWTLSFCRIREEGSSPKASHGAGVPCERLAEQARKTKQNEPSLPSNVESEMEK